MAHTLTVQEAIDEYDLAAETIGSCGDGYCVVKRPVGQHTNGGCRCSTDKYKAQRMMMAASRLRNALARDGGTK
jgi:hypothetical protein